MQRLLAALVGLVFAFGITPAGAQPYPNCPVKLIVPFPAGGLPG